MKSGTVMLVIILLTLNCLSACNKNKEMYSIAINGLNMREKPSINSKALVLIPYNEKVLELEKSDNALTIDNIKGHWVKVSWNNRTGWVFDGFLKQKYDGKCSIYNLYNTICFDNDKLDNIIKNNYPRQSELFYWDNGLDASLTMFDEIPGIIPNDEILIISKDKILEDKISSLYFYRSEVAGSLLRFKLQNENIEDFSDVCTLYVKKSELLAINNKLPIINNLEAVDDESLRNKFLTEVSNKRTGDIGQGSENFGIKGDFIRKFIIANFDFKLYKLNAHNYLKKIYILKYINNDPKLHYYNFSAIYIDNEMVYLDSSKISASYYFNNKNYILIHEWLTGSGYQRNCLYEISDTALVVIHSDSTFAN